MKIAYCFSGYMRRFWDNPTIMAHIIGPTPGDLFVHTWDALNFNGATWHGDQGLSDIAVDANLVALLHNRFGTPAGLAVEKPPQFPPHLMPAIQARYSCWRANELKSKFERKHRFRYDLVVNMRFDLYLHEPVRFSERIDAGELYGLGHTNCVKQRLCSDILNVGSSAVMDVVNELYAAIRDGVVSEANTLGGERLLTKWCALQGIPFRYLQARCSLMRTNGVLQELPLQAA